MLVALIHAREHPPAPDGPLRHIRVREAPSQPRLASTHPFQKALQAPSPFASVFHPNAPLPLLGPN